MTESEAWRFIAEKFCESCYFSRWGLCYVIVKLRRRKAISFAVLNKMVWRLGSYFPTSIGGYLLPVAEINKPIRVLVALFLAAIADEEKSNSD